MKKLSFKSFNNIYQESVLNILKYWTPQMQAEMAVHNYGWREGCFDFKRYLEASARRYYNAYICLSQSPDKKTICDIGGFWGVWPLTLKSIGYEVTMTESLEFYSKSFSDLFSHLSDRGINIVNYNPFDSEEPLKNRFDFISVMAVLEHYPYSLKRFMKNIVSLMNDGGQIYIEVPNIAYWPKRIGLLCGRTPLVQLSEIYHSDVPFIGHHHEFTRAELKDLAMLSGLNILKIYEFNYSQNESIAKSLVTHPIQTIAFLVAPSTRECISILCKKER